MKEQINFVDLLFPISGWHSNEGGNLFILNRTFEVMRNLSAVILLLFFASCTTRGIIPDAIVKGETININVAKVTGRPYATVYSVTIQKTGEEYELIHVENSFSTSYKLPANKLELLSEMETNLKELQPLHAKYFLLTISAGKKNKTYKINTDIVHDLITGLKKK